MQILVFGDSITYGAWDEKELGWVQRLRKFLDTKTTAGDMLYNLGIDGDNTQGVLNRLEQETKPRLWPGEETMFIIAIGGNDTLFNNEQKTCKTDAEQFKANINKLIDIAKGYSSRIVFVGIAPQDESKTYPKFDAGIPGSYSYRAEYLAQYNGILKATCKERGVPFINIYDRLNNPEFLKTMPDGVHPDSKGHKKIFSIVRSNLVKQGLIVKGSNA